MTRRRAAAVRGLLLSLVSALAASLLVSVGTGPAAAQSADLHLARLLADGTLVQPTAVAGIPRGADRLYVVERAGRVRVVDPRTRRVVGTFLDLRSLVNDASGEQGMLGMAFDPDFGRGRPYVYVTYTGGSGELRLDRLTHRGGVVLSSRRTVLVVPHPGNTNHNGGQLAFGRDGTLFLGTGDGGGAGDPGANGQDRRTLLGKILRIDTRRSCSGRIYCVPGDNPWATSTTYRREIWAYGLRNPWRFSVDRSLGTLWIADVGQSSYEEVTTLRTSGAVQRGANLGWSCREGDAVYDASRCTGATLTAPRITYGRSSGGSITGGYVYNGAAYARQLRGSYVYADFVSGRVWRTLPGGTSKLEATVGGITAFGESQRGELFAVTYGGGLHALRAR